MKESFIFYLSFFEALKELPDEVRLKMYDMIATYALTGEEMECTGVEKAVFTLIKPQINANNQRYENGCKGGAPKGNKNAEKKAEKGRKKTTSNNQETTSNNQETTEKQPKNNQKQPNENENDNVNENDNPFFISPTGGQKNNFADKFFALYPRYAKDRQKFSESYDYQRLLEEFEKSSYLRSLYTAKQVIDIYPLIETGEYRDKEPKKDSVEEGREYVANRERWYTERRNAAKKKAEEIYKRFMQDEQFAKIDKRLKAIPIEQAKAEAKGDTATLAKLEREHARLTLQRRGIIERNGMTEEDLLPRWHCQKCQDTGFLTNGTACDCYAKEK